MMSAMPSRITLIVSVESQQSDIVGLVDSLDAQTLSYRDFEVFFLLTDAGREWGVRLSELALHRPNVRVWGGQSDAEPAAPEAVLAEATGEYVLHIDAGLLAEGVVLLPDALRRLGEFAALHGCDVVVGRNVSPQEFRTPLIFAGDAGRWEPELHDVPATSPLLVRRELLTEVGLQRDQLLAFPSVGVLASYPTARLAAATSAETEPLLENLKTELEWRDGVLELSVRADVVPQRRVTGGQLWLREHASLVEFWVPVDTSAGEPGVFTASARIDPGTAAGGEALPVGVWLCGLALATEDSPLTLSRVVLPRSPAPHVLLAGQPIALVDVAGQLALDVGAKRHRLVGRFAPSQVTIDETARGTLMVVRLPNIRSYGSTNALGSVLLDRFRLPAELVGQEGQDTELRCYVSGLAGTSSISTQFFSPRPSPSGVDLKISKVGIMSVKRTKAPVAPSPAAPAVDRPAPALPKGPGVPRLSAAARPLVRRLRRAVPAPLEPAARTLAKSPVLAAAYRRVAGIPTAKR